MGKGTSGKGLSGGHGQRAKGKGNTDACAFVYVRGHASNSGVNETASGMIIYPGSSVLYTRLFLYGANIAVPVQSPLQNSRVYLSKRSAGDADQVRSKKLFQ